jgi:multicomponent Na+:H+ antiporter subunit D
VLPADLPGLHETLLWAGVSTMLLGGLGALSQYRIQSILTWHIVSQIGFMVTALALHSPLGFAAALAITLHNILVKSSLLLCGGTVAAISGTDDVRHAGRLWLATPVFGVLFLLQALSLAGIPPLSGFWGKLMLFQDLADQSRWVVVGLAAVGSLLTLASMLKIFLGAFWSNGTREPRVSAPVRRRVAVISLLVAGALAAGPFGGWFVRASVLAGEQALDREGYRDAVLRESAKPMEGKR